MNKPRLNQRIQYLNSLHEQTVEEKAKRYLSIDHQGIVGNHHFAVASDEAIRCYEEGLYVSCIMATQAVTEGILKFLVERNPDIDDSLKGEIAIVALEGSGHITQECRHAFQIVRKSFRNDYHHMNPKVGGLPHKELAQKIITSLANIEKEIFAVSYSNGKLVPAVPRYWDSKKEGTVGCFLRFA